MTWRLRHGLTWRLRHGMARRLRRGLGHIGKLPRWPARPIRSTAQPRIG